MCWGGENEPSQNWFCSTGMAGRLYGVTTTTVICNLQKQMGEEKQDLYKSTVKCHSLVFPFSSLKWAWFLGKKSLYYISQPLKYFMVVFFFFVNWLLIVLVVCSVSREDSSQSLTSCFNLLPSPMDPTVDRLPGKASTQRYAWAYKWLQCFDVMLPTDKAEGLIGNLTWKIGHEQGCFLSCDLFVGFSFMHFEQILNKMRWLTWKKRLKVTVSCLF